MADPFTNARAYFDVTFPTSGDGFSISKMRNALSGLGFLDMIPLQPRAHNPQDTKIMVRGRDASAYYNPIYAGDSNTRLAFSSGDSPAMAAPATNPRIDIVYLTASGDIKVITGTEAVSPTLPTLAPSGDSRLPIAAIWLKPSMTKIVNFEDKDSNSGDGYIYQDLRPFLRSPGAGAAILNSVTTPIAPTGDAQAAVGTIKTAARADHVHGGVHAIRKVGSSNLQGDIELAGNPAGVLTQAGNRITINSPFSASYVSSAQTITAGGALTLAHGLGATPSLLSVRLVCIIAESNYSIGDEIFINPATNESNSTASTKGISVVPDATNLNIRIGSATQAFDILDKTTGTVFAATNANWNMIFRAWV